MSPILGTAFRLHTKRLAGLLVLLAALALVACGGASEPTPTPPAPAPDDAGSEAEEPESPAGGEESPPSSSESGAESTGQGFFRVAMQPIVNIDPIQISSDSEVLVANHVYDYLVDIDPQSNPIPRLATAWDVSDDGLSWVFSLAESASWHDGTPFSAADVVWTFDRLRATEGTPTFDLYSNIETIEATGEFEVTFTLTNPNPFFLYDLSDNHALVLKAGTSDAETTFNGTGPFMVTSYLPEDRIVMSANPAYFIPGQPRLAGLEIIFFGDETAAVEALRSGQIDLVMRMSTSLFNSLQGEPGIETIDIPTNGFDVIRLRSDRAPGDDPRVIQALKLATDRAAILNVVQQGYGALGNDSPIGPLYGPYHDPTVLPPVRDVATARELLAEAGYDESNPLQMVLHAPDTGGRPDLAAVLQDQWAEAGVAVELSIEPESVYYGDDGWLEVDLGITGWGSRPYPQFYLDVMLVSGAKWNESHFADPELDALSRTTGTTLDEQERIAAYGQIQRILAERGPIIVPYFFAQFAALSDQFENFELKAFAGRTDFREVVFSGEG